MSLHPTYYDQTRVTFCLYCVLPGICLPDQPLLSEDCEHCGRKLEIQVRPSQPVSVQDPTYYRENSYGGYQQRPLPPYHAPTTQRPGPYIESNYGGGQYSQQQSFQFEPNLHRDQYRENSQGYGQHGQYQHRTDIEPRRASLVPSIEDSSNRVPPTTRPIHRGTRFGTPNPKPTFHSRSQAGTPSSGRHTPRRNPFILASSRYSPYHPRSPSNQPAPNAAGAMSHGRHGYQRELGSHDNDYCLHCSMRGHLYDQCDVTEGDDTHMEELRMDYITDFGWTHQHSSPNIWPRIRHREPQNMRHLLDHVQMLLEDMKGFDVFFKKINTLFGRLLTEEADHIALTGGLREDGRPQWESLCYSTIRSANDLLKKISMSINNLLRVELLPRFGRQYSDLGQLPSEKDRILEAAHQLRMIPGPKAPRRGCSIPKPVIRLFKEEIEEHFWDYIRQMVDIEVDFINLYNSISHPEEPTLWYKNLALLPTADLRIQFDSSEENSWIPIMIWPQVP